MPHTSRKNRGVWHSKRVNLEGDDGWTVVANSSQPPQTRPPLLQTALGPALIPPGASLEKVIVDFERCQKIWHISKSCEGVNGILNRLSCGTLARCVCVGLGSFVNAMSRKPALLQLAALQSILTSLQRCRESRIPVYAQDPVFNALDIEFLTSLDFTTIHSPHAFDMMDESTVIYAPHCERSFFFPGIKGKDPQLVICNSMEPLISGPMSGCISSEDLDIAQAFLQGRTGYEFPIFHEDETVFNDLTIYIKDESSAD